MPHIELLASLAAALLAAGLFAGLLAGLLGVGGGIIMVPVLYYVFGLLGVDESVRMHMSVGTSLAAMIPTSIRSALAHRKKGAVDEAMFRRWLAGIALGVLFGVLTAASVKGPVLMTVFAVFALAVAFYMAFGKDSWRVASELPGRAGQTVMAVLIAGVSVMMGIGGGTFTVPTLTLFGYPIHRAVGTAAAIGVLIAVPGAVGFILGGLGEPDRPWGSLGFANVVGVVALIPTTLLAAPWGVALAHKLERRWLRLAFALFLAATGIKMALSLIGI
ncbi:MAG: sulfite exporter TauE/SafE family protein [Brevundimonas sp.]|uniref:sulfite exporter TauE/SafE family protein n=1 Tax=Brevundimonas sp. TaxID=1871086 RepID=UPI0024888AFA|nr:sulfite exporter TauE/SafE family protein [Brevundimonas sp.]MDI1326228.1 sulfite exporter TauE/SafE family protein [Brevundimonas sp.]